MKKLIVVLLAMSASAFGHGSSSQPKPVVPVVVPAAGQTCWLFLGAYAINAAYISGFNYRERDHTIRIVYGPETLTYPAAKNATPEMAVQNFYDWMKMQCANQK
jgi:hypothetical protein